MGSISRPMDEPLDQFDPSRSKKHEDQFLTKKTIAATSGAIITSLFVTPFDVAKTRLQSQLAMSPTPLRARPHLIDRVSCRSQRGLPFKGHVPTCRKHCRWRVYQVEPTLSTATVARPACRPLSSFVQILSVPPISSKLTGTFHALKVIQQTQGLAGLWTGLSPALMLAIPSTALYFTAYDTLLTYGRSSSSSNSPQISTWNAMLMPMLAGSSARIFAATIVAPIELVRTQMQAHRRKMSMRQTLSAALDQGGPRSLYRGLNATLARDVPFSAIYWTMYELMKERLGKDDCHPESRNRLMGRSFVSGAVAGAVAATVTTPFDVVKTLHQINADPSCRRSKSRQTMMKTFRHVVQKDGMCGLFVGLSARLAKIIPACGIMISSYEVGKVYLGTD